MAHQPHTLLRVRFEVVNHAPALPEQLSDLRSGTPLRPPVRLLWQPDGRDELERLLLFVPVVDCGSQNLQVSTSPGRTGRGIHLGSLDVWQAFLATRHHYLTLDRLLDVFVFPVSDIQTTVRRRHILKILVAPPALEVADAVDSRIVAAACGLGQRGDMLIEIEGDDVDDRRLRGCLNLMLFPEVVLQRTFRFFNLLLSEARPLSMWSIGDGPGVSGLVEP